MKEGFQHSRIDEIEVIEMANDALSKFASALFSEATGKKLSSVKAYNTQMQKEMEEQEKALRKKAEKAIADYKTRYRYEISLTLARRKNELHTALIQNRGRVFDEVFSKVTENLQAFTRTEKYTAYLEKEMQPYTEIFDRAGTECIAMEADIPKLKELFAKWPYTFAVSKKDIIGGFILKNEEARLYVDCSLAAKLEEQKDKFYSSSGLIIE